MRVRLNILIFLVLCKIALPAQDDVYTLVKTMPEFPGGMNAMVQYITKNTQYPAEARENGYTGKTYINFVIDTNGTVTAPKVIKSSGHKCLDDEALRMVGAMPKWSPGSDSLTKVKVSLNVPVGFKNHGFVNAPSEQKRMTPEEQMKHDEAMKYYYEGHKLEGQYKYDKALEKYNKSLTIESENKYSMFDKGKMLMVLGDKIGACETWNKMIESDLRKDEAEEFVKKYCEDENGPAEMLKYLNQKKGANFFDESMKDIKNGRYEAALHKLDSSLKYRPEHKDALFNKAMMHFKLDQKNAACASWKKLFEITPEDKEVEELIKKNCN